MSKKNREFKFYMVNTPSEELIKEFHDSLAKSLIEKFGMATMKEVVRQIQEKDSKNKQ